MAAIPSIPSHSFLLLYFLLTYSSTSSLATCTASSMSTPEIKSIVTLIT